MTDVLQTIAAAKSDTRHEDISVFEQTIRAGTRTIAIANIAHLEVGELSGNVAGKVFLFLLGAAAAIVAFVGLASGSLGVVLIFAIVAGGAFFFLTRLKADFIFSITTNDGSRTSFIGKNHKLLQEACDFVTWKINASDTSAKTYFNFNNNTISGSQIGGTIENR